MSAGWARAAGLVAVAGVTFLAALGLSPQFAALRLVVYAVLAAGALLVTLWRPWTAVVIGVVEPFVDSLGTAPLLGKAALALMLTAVVRAWPGAGAPARRGALAVAALGVATLVIGVGLAPPGAGSGGTARAVGYATVLGVCAALVGMSELRVVVPLAALGSVAAAAALSTEALRTSRDTVVLGENANGVGLVAALGLVAGLVAVGRPGVWVRLLGAASAVACTMGLVVTGSRGGLLAAVAGVGTLLCHRAIQSHPLWMVPAIGIVLGLVVVASGPLTARFLQLAGRDAGGAQANTASREDAVRYALQQGMTHPVRGVGLGRLAEFSLSDPGSGLGLRAHNVFAGTFAESGVLALAALAAVSLAAVARARAHSPAGLLPVVAAILAGGFFLEWWGAGRTGPLALFILGSAVGLGGGVAGDPGPVSVGASPGEVAVPAGGWRVR